MKPYFLTKTTAPMLFVDDLDVENLSGHDYVRYAEQCCKNKYNKLRKYVYCRRNPLIYHYH